MACRKMNIICAMDSNGGIGLKNRLPWKLKKEFDHFVALTVSVTDSARQNAVLMARRTWESIPACHRPLPKRVNVVITRQPDYNAGDGVHVAHSLEEAMQLVASPPLCNHVETVWNLGGVSIYQESLEKCLVQRMYLTQIDAEYECDTFFPAYDSDRFVEISDERVPTEVQEEKGTQWRYHVYEAKV